MAVPADQYMAAADGLLERLGRDHLLNKREMEAVRKDLRTQIRQDMSQGVESLQVQKMGRVKALVPNSANLRAAGVVSRRTRERMSNFSLSYLSQGQVEAMKNGAGPEGLAVGSFVRNSHRLARHTREFLTRIKEVEPSLAEEVDRTIAEMEDNRMDLVKLEAKSFTTATEQLIRSVNGRLRKGDAVQAAKVYDLDKSLWNNSLIEHPKAVSRGLLDAATRRMGEQVSAKVSEIPKRSHVFVGADQESIKAMTRGSRVSGQMWRVMSLQEVDDLYRKKPGKGITTPSGLGLGFSTPEIYVPIPPGSVDDIRDVMAERREKFLAELDRKAETKAQDAAGASAARAIATGHKSSADAAKRRERERIDASKGTTGAARATTSSVIADLAVEGLWADWSGERASGSSLRFQTDSGHVSLGYGGGKVRWKLGKAKGEHDAPDNPSATAVTRDLVSRARRGELL